MQKFPVKLPLTGVDMAISAYGLQLDLSGEQLLQDAAFEERWAEARSAFRYVHEILAQAYGKDPVKGLLFAPEKLA